MKNKLLIAILVIVLGFIAVWAIGANHWSSIKTHQQLPASPLSSLILVGVGFAVILGNPLWILIAIAAGSIFYFIYDNFARNKNKDVLVFDQPQLSSEINSSTVIDSEKRNKSDKVFNKIALIFILLTLLYIGIIAIVAANTPQGGGMVTFAFMLPVLPIALVVFPVYFAILAIRYSREKSDMYIFDKVSFYILLICIGGFFLMAISKLFK